MRYYYSLNNQPLGPIPLEQLHELFRSGTVTAETLVVAEGGSEWKPYSTLTPPPASAPSTSMPAPLSTPAPAPAASTTTPPTGAASGPFATSPMPPSGSQFTPPNVPTPGYKNLVLISWILLGGCALLSVIPVIGCLSWVMFIPIFITTIVLGFLTLSRGGTRDGVLILIASIVILPAFTLIAPILTTALFGKVTGVGDKTNDPQSSPSRITSATPAATAAPAATTAPTATRPAAAAPAVSAELPTAANAKMMVNNTMLNFKNAINSGDFEAFYRTQLSDLWKKETTPEQLKTTFKTFVDKKIDLSPIFFVEPVLEPAPQMDNNGMLVLKGHYPVAKENVNVNFELSYSREAKWGLSGINVKIRPISQ
jgi:hypothetical protein